MGVFQAIAKGFTAVAKNIKLLGILIGVSIIIMLISIPIVIGVFGQTVFQPGMAPSPDQMAEINWTLFWLIFIPFVLVSVAVNVFINAGVLASVKDIVKTGTCQLNNFIAYAKKFFVKILLIDIVMVLITLVIVVILSLLVGMVGQMAGTMAVLAAILGIVLFLVVVATIVLLTAFYGFAPVALVADEKGVVESMGRALNFIKARLWSVAGLVALFVGMFIVTGVINYVGTNLFIIQLVVSLINMYLSLVFVISFMSYYLGNSGAPAEQPPQAGQA